MINRKTDTDISFVILTWNSEAYIVNCLESLLSSLAQTNFDYHIYITDNGSGDKTPVILNTFQNMYPDKITLFMLSTNMGTTYSRNLGVKRADSKYICILDSDVELFSGVFEGVVSLLEKDSGIGLVVPRIFYPDGRLQKSTDQFPTLGRKVYRYFCLRTIEKKEDLKQTGNFPVSVDYAISAFWMLRREVVDQVGLLDEKIFYAPEDVDYCLRVWKAGYAIIYTPSVSVVHHTQEISRDLKLNSAFFNHIKGLAYYFLKHRYFLKNPTFKRYLN